MLTIHHGRRLLLALLVTLAFCVPVQAAPAFVEIQTGTADAATTTIDIANLDATGSDRLLFVGLAMASTLAACESATVTWDPDASVGGDDTVTFFSGSKNNNPSQAGCLYRLIAPTTGTNGTVHISGLNAALTEAAFAITYSGVDQTTPWDTLDLAEACNGGASPCTATDAGAAITSPAGDCIVSVLHSGGDGTPAHAVDAGWGGGAIRGATAANGNAAITIADDCDGADDTPKWTHDSLANVGAISFNMNAAAAAGSRPPNADNTTRFAQ